MNRYIIFLSILFLVTSSFATSSFAINNNNKEIRHSQLANRIYSSDEEITDSEEECYLVGFWKKMFPKEDNGPWICPKCGFSNPENTIMCKNCAFPFESEIEAY